jgi:flavin reductase
MDERFTAGHWSVGPSASPHLEDASVSFDCRLSQITEVGTHDILICEVLSITVSEEARSLIYFNRQYHELSMG